MAEAGAVPASSLPGGGEMPMIGVGTWPPPGRKLCHVWQEFLTLRDEGRARAVGVSNYSIAQIDRLTEVCGEAPAVNQIPWSPARHDPALLAAHTERGVAVEGYSPLKGTNLADPLL